MKKYLLPEKGLFYKANLHAHTTVSDGAMTPEASKAAYKEKGYSILALTDHERLLDHTALSDDDFLMLTGYEMSFTQKAEPETPYSLRKTCHINLFARDPHNTRQVVYDPSLDPLEDERRRPYSPECVNQVVRKALEGGFLAQYNHPGWSLEDLSDYGGYEGFFAMEVYNNGCYVEGVDEFNDAAYEALLRRGKRLALTANDDNHNRSNQDSFGGFTMIGARALDYGEVIGALDRGDFYASTGPAFKALWVEDGVAHVECTPALAAVHTRGRRAERTQALVTGFDFALDRFDGYARFTLTDAHGKRAWTRAYFPEEMGR